MLSLLILSAIMLCELFIHYVFIYEFIGGWLILLIKIASDKIAPRKAKILNFLGVLFFPPLMLVFALKQKSWAWKIYGGFNLVVIIILLALTVSYTSIHTKRPYRDDQFLKISKNDNSSETSAKLAINDIYVKVTSLEDAHDKKSPVGVVIFRLGRYADSLESHAIEPQRIESELKKLEPYLDDKKLTSHEVDQWVRDTMPSNSKGMK